MKTITKYIDSLKLNIDYIVGGNAQENHDIIDEASEEDLWFHISNQSSCHVICKMPVNENIDKKGLQKIIIQGAVICKAHSRYKSQKNIGITYTKVLHVKKLDKPGLVSIMNEKTIIM
jgi:predicted ribosome quality control (RQC) complex YloA/Tae2 family protein